jgi:hypothetical protein
MRKYSLFFVIVLGLLIADFPQIAGMSLEARAAAQFSPVPGQLTTAGTKGGVSWGDFNHDGLLDIAIMTDVAGASTGRVRLYQQGPVGSFVDVTSTHAPGLLNNVGGRCVIWADANNDGYLDLARNGAGRVEIYFNKGPSGSPAYGLGDLSGNPNQVITSSPLGFNVEFIGWMDYDLDGDLDLVTDNQQSTLLFENDGAGGLTYVDTLVTGLPGSGAGDGDYGAVVDFDIDGDPDLLIRKSAGIDLWVNNVGSFSAGTFDEVAANGNKGGVTFADFDNDGDFDIFWTDNGTNQIWEQTTPGNFIATGQPVGVSGNIDGVVAGDADNDGQIDLVLSSSGNDQIFINTTSGGPISFAVSPLVIGSNNGEGIALADYDRDGDLDLITNQNGNAELWRNDTDNTNYLVVRALHDLGGGVLRDAVGAVITLRDSAGVVLHSIREVSGGRGHGSQDPAYVHFGLPASGPDVSYNVEVTFVGGATVQANVVPSDLGGYQLFVITDTGNTGPFAASAIADTTVTEDALAIDNYRDLNTVFQDVEDGSALAYVIQSNSNPALVTAVIDADSAVDLSFAPDQYGSATIIVRATDSGSVWGTDVFVIIVSPVNDPPTLASAIPDTTVAEDSPFNDYRDLNNVFSDIEDGSALSFSVQSNSNPALITPVIDTDSTLDLTLALDQNGSATLVIRATDSGSLFVEDTLTVTTTPVDDAPRIAVAIPDTTVNENNGPIDNYRDFNSVFNDPEEGDALTFSIQSNSNPALVTVSIDADSALDFSFAPGLDGIATIVVRATDSGAQFVDDTVLVMVTSPTINDARLFYGEGAVAAVRQRLWDESLGAWSPESSTPAANSTIKFTVNQVATDGSEELLGVLSDTGAGSDLDMLRWDGSGWSVDWSAAAITGTNAIKRGFDIEYEHLSNEALVVYSNNTATPVYRTRTGGAWLAETPLPLNDGGGPNPDPNSGIVLWTELVRRPGTDEIALAYADANSDLVVIVWDGAQWLTASAAALETNLKRNPSTNTISNRVFDLAYEETTGDLMAAWGRQSSTGFWYSTKATGGNTWAPAAQVSSAPANGVTHYLDLASEPAGQRIAAGAFDMGDGIERLGLATWSGSAWVDGGEYDSQTRDVNDSGTGDFAGAVGWIGPSGTAIAIYPDNQTGTIDWATWTSGGGWVVQADEPIPGKGFTESVHIEPFAGASKLMAILSDSNSDLYAATFDGIAWTITNSGSPLEDALSSLDSAPFGLAFELDDPPAVVSAVPDTVVRRDSGPVDNYRDLNNVFADVREGSALSFSIQSNSNPGLVSVVLDADSALDLSFTPGQTGQATIVIRATDSALQFVEDTFAVTVAGPTLSSAANQNFTVGDPPTGISLITITDDALAPTITAANDIRVRIDSLFNMAWDAAVTTATIGGSAAGKVSTTVSYDSTWQILLIDVTSDFAPGDQITVSGLSFRDFAAASPPDSLELEVYNDATPSAFDDKTIEIAAAAFPNILSGQADQVYNVGDPTQATRKMTVSDASIPIITAANDVRVRIPAGLNMVWDTSDLTAKIVGTAAPKVSTTVGYEDGGKTLVLNVLSDFTAGDFIHFRELGFTNFTARSPADNLEMELLNDGGTSGLDDKTITINDGPIIVSAIPDTTVSESAPPVDNYRDLNDVFDDVEDGSALAFTIESNSDTSLVAVVIDADSALDFSFAPAGGGSATIVVRATDQYGLFVEDTLVVTVTNPPTVVSAIPDTTVAEDSAPIDNYRDLNDVFTDAADGSALAFSVQNNSNPGLVSVVIDADSALDFSFAPDVNGNATIVIRATDSGSLFVEDTLAVAVTPVNDQPAVTTAIPDTTVAEDSTPINNYRDLNDVFSDLEDGSALSFTIESNSNPALVTVAIGADSALDLSLAPDLDGGATIVVRATDSGALFVEDTLLVTVTAVNDQPTIASAIPDTTVNEDNAPIDNYQDLNNLFADLEDGSALSFSIESNSNPGLVIVAIDADSALDLSLAPDLDGSATIVVRATDSGALFVEDTFVVTVTPVNDQPTIAAAIPDTTVNEDNAPINNYRDLNDVFADLEDGSALSFSIESNNNPALVTVAIGADSALDLSFTPDLSGSATIVVRATDSGALFVEDTFVVTVTPVNDQPTIAAAIPDTTVAEDNAPINNYRDLNDVFDDAEDSSALSFSIESNSNPALVTVAVDADSALDLSFAPSQSGSATIVVRATDAGALFAEDTFIINISSVNDAPTIASAVPDTTVNEDNAPIDNYRDLNSVFADIEDGSALSFSIESNSNPALVTVAIDADSALDLSFAPDSSGNATIVVRATDSGALFVEDTFVVTVTPVNDQPTIAAAIPDTTVAEDNPPIDNYRDLNDVFADLEDGSALSFSIESNSNPALVTVAIGADSALDLSFAPDLSGSATIVVRAADSGALFVEATLVVTVTPVNDAPTVATAISDTTVAEDNPPIDNYRDLNDVFADIEDGFALSFSIESNSNPGLVTVAVDADSALDLSFTPSQSGSATIVVRATDAGALFAEDTFIINVSSVNDAPTVAAAIPDTTVNEDDAPIDDYRDLNSVFTDIEDGSVLSFSIESNSNPGLVTVAVDADSALDLSFTPDLSGSATIVVRATDSGALFVEDTFVVTVTPVNDQPTIVAAIPDTTVAEDNAPIDNYRDLNDVFADLEDGSALSFSIESNSNPALMTVAIGADSALDLSFTPELSGSATIVVRATDSGPLFVEDTFVVTVTPVNDQPTVAAAIPDTTVIQDSPPVDNYGDLNDIFADIEDGSALAFAVQSNSNPGLVSVVIDADSALDLSFTPGQNGTATVVIRATDSGALFAEDAFVVTVNPSPISSVTLVDSAGTSYPTQTFVADPALALKVGLNNFTSTGVMLDTTSSVIFSDSATTYQAKLANPTYIPPNAMGFTATFASSAVNGGLTAPASYDLQLILEGTDDASSVYADTFLTTGRNSIFIDVPKVRISSIALQTETVQPGSQNRELLALHFENEYATDRTLDTLASMSLTMSTRAWGFRGRIRSLPRARSPRGRRRLSRAVTGGFRRLAVGHSW